MSQTERGRALRTAEFVPLVGLLMSLVALAIDAMLPALPAIGRDFGVSRPNDVQMVIMSLFLGLGIGQLLFGPLSDSIGRRPAVHAGLALFMIGCLVSIFAPSFEVMIAGRVLQGIGVAGPRIVTMALVRDQYEGDDAKAPVVSRWPCHHGPTVAPASAGRLILGGWGDLHHLSSFPRSSSHGLRCASRKPCLSSGAGPSRCAPSARPWARY